MYVHTHLAGPPGRRYVFHIHLPTRTQLRPELNRLHLRAVPQPTNLPLDIIKVSPPVFRRARISTLRGTIKTRLRNKCVFPRSLWKRRPGWPPRRVSSQPRRGSFVTSILLAPFHPPSPPIRIPSLLLFAIRDPTPAANPRKRNKRADAIKSSRRDRRDASTRRRARSYKLIQITPRHYPPAIWNRTRNRRTRGVVRFVFLRGGTD